MNMRQCALTGCVIAILTLPVCAVAEQPENSPPECKEWFAAVDPSQGASRGWVEQPLSDAAVLKAIDCLLLLRGNKKPARFSGVTHYEVSQQLPEASVELAALYYVSYLFTGNKQYCDGVALWNDKGVINPEGAIDAAYKAYAAWFQRVQAIGLPAARKQKLDPLCGTGLGWYGNWPEKCRS